MHFTLCLSFVASVCGVVAQNTATSASDVAAAAATALTRSPVSNVPGKAFNRIAIIWLENTDYNLAITDPNLAYLAKKGITLSSYHGVTHPSQPNYVASHGGDNFGLDNDGFYVVASNVSSVVDLLEDKGISWGEYQEDMPYSGFEGIAYVNQVTHANDYVRKHNPAVNYGANNVPLRLAQMKNFTLFYEDLAANTLPQWMFITPNMTNDGHDTSITKAGKFARSFVDPLLANPNFTNNTLILITFDENHTYSAKNTVLGILLGDAIPTHLVGTTDSNFYDHYSELATVEANWGLHTLGRWDVGANVFSFVASKTGDILRAWKKPKFSGVFLNSSYAGPLNANFGTAPYPVPNTNAKHGGRTVLPSIKSTWGSMVSQTIYTTGVEISDGMHPPPGYAVNPA